MKAMLLVPALVSLVGASSASAYVKSDPRPAGGHNIRSERIPAGTCKRVLMYYNKFSRAYTTVCNKGFFQTGPSSN